MENIRGRTKKLAVLAMMLALITVVSALEHMLPPLPLLPPHMRLGLSNVVTMYTLFFLGSGSAVALAFLKSLFVFLMRGATAGFLSLCGGMLSICVIILLATVTRERGSYLFLSAAGALAHNTGQMLAASVVLQTDIVFYYLPVLMVSGILLGCLSGTVLRIVMPVFHKTLGRE